MPLAAIPEHTIPDQRDKKNTALFFSGGTALKDIARSLSVLTPASVHIVATFDSGGSSAELRRVFGLPAVGDLRQRLISLADVSDPAVRGACAFFERRFPRRGKAETLRADWHAILAGKHRWFEGLAPSFADLFLTRLNAIEAMLPADFDLRRAALGNLILTADYLDQDQSLRGVLRRFSVLFRTRGQVVPVSEDPVHLAACFNSGKTLIGQHRFTGKKSGYSGRFADPASIVRLFYCAGLQAPAPLHPACGADIPELIRSASLICYPPGSFFSSLLANLGLTGIGRAVAESPALKIYMPNPGPDPESFGLTLRDQVETLIGTLVADAPGTGPQDMLHCLLVDSRADYAGGIPEGWCRKQGISLAVHPFTRPGHTFPRANPAESARILYQMASGTFMPYPSCGRPLPSAL